MTTPWNIGEGMAVDDQNSTNVYNSISNTQIAFSSTTFKFHQLKESILEPQKLKRALGTVVSQRCQLLWAPLSRAIFSQWIIQAETYDKVMCFRVESRSGLSRHINGIVFVLSLIYFDSGCVQLNGKGADGTNMKGVNRRMVKIVLN